MLRQIFSGLAMAVVVTVGGKSAFAADPTIQQVYEQANAGHLAQAQQMMTQVLRDHPNSGKAHFVEAELLAKQGRLNGAQSELATAERLEPGLPFAKPAAVQELKSLLNNGAVHASPAAFVAPATAGAGGFPWGIAIAVLGGVALIAYIIHRRAQQTVIHAMPAGATYGGGYAGYSSGTPAYGNGPGPMSPSSGMGSGILGSLATGAAVGAGVVAGEALMHRVLDGNSFSGLSSPTPTITNDWNRTGPSPEQNYEMGGNDFGLNDDTSWDDNVGSNGGDDWS